MEAGEVAEEGGRWRLKWGCGGEGVRWLGRRVRWRWRGEVAVEEVEVEVAGWGGGGVATRHQSSSPCSRPPKLNNPTSADHSLIPTWSKILLRKSQQCPELH